MDGSFPIWVECSFHDAWGNIHCFIEKLPCVSDVIVDVELPQNGVLECMIIKEWIDSKNRKIISVSTKEPFGIESTQGASEFDLLPCQMRLRYVSTKG